MADLSKLKRDKIAQAIYDQYVQKREDWRRPHLGASKIGEKCNRELWYLFRWAVEPKFASKLDDHDGRILRLFETGDLEEDRIADNIRSIGIRLSTEDADGNQWSFQWLGGHFGGSCDGIGDGVPGAEKTVHVHEFKTANAKWFKAIKKNGVEKAKPEHYAQMQVYMHGFIEGGVKANRALYVVVCKETDEIYTERVKYDKEKALVFLHRARLVVHSPEPLSKIQDDPTRIECKFCDYRGACQFNRVEDLQRNCRTCQASTPLDDGTWFCDHWQKVLSVPAQREGCEKHLFIPSLLLWQPVDVDDKERLIVYEDDKGTRYTDSLRQLTVSVKGEDIAD